MSESEIRKYALLMKELDLTGLEMGEGTARIRLERSVPAPAAAVVEIPAAVAPAVPSSDAPEPHDYVSVVSPIVGVFYAAPAENADPFASIGDRVTKGQTLCIVEAMKLMNEIPSEVDGVISEICVTNGQVVEYGTELFRITR